MHCSALIRSLLAAAVLLLPSAIANPIEPLMPAVSHLPTPASDNLIIVYGTLLLIEQTETSRLTTTRAARQPTRRPSPPPSQSGATPQHATSAAYGVGISIYSSAVAGLKTGNGPGQPSTSTTV
ncbi:hypothetical protein V8F33_005491 [Rhypophila sp. PSN 637]